jgi:hypothetical protein
MSTFERLPFREFEFRGFLGKRRTVFFGWRYDFNLRELQPTEPIPTFLLALRQKAAEFASLSEDGLQHALVTEYSPGAAIGWHKDRPEFAEVIGPLGAPRLFRFRRKEGTRWQRVSTELRSREVGSRAARHELGVLERLDQQARQLEVWAKALSFEAVLAEERQASSVYGGRSVFGWERDAGPLQRARHRRDGDAAIS